jgi:hypothetical protein
MSAAAAAVLAAASLGAAAAAAAVLAATSLGPTLIAAHHEVFILAAQTQKAACTVDLSQQLTSQQPLALSN